MRSETLDKVTQALTLEGVSMAELQKKTGLAYNTIKHALEKLDVGYIPESFPKLWTSDTELSTPRAVLIEGEDIIRIGIAKRDDWPSRWDDVRREIGSSITKLQIKPSSDPTVLSEEFARAARSLASIAYALQQAQDKPDWFALVGGQIDPK